MAQSKKGKEVVFIDGGRTPFLRAGTEFKKLSAYDLGRRAIAGLISRTKLDGEHIDRVFYGNVIQDINTSNVARESSLAAGLPESIPATTVSMACISSNMALTMAKDTIETGNARAAIVGGTEVMSDIPIRFRKKFRQKLLETQRYKSPADYLKFFKNLKPSDLLPEIPSIAEFSTGETMGQSCDKMAAKYDISREEQDAYALRSHLKADQSRDQLLKEIFPVSLNKGESIVKEDNGIRGDSSPEKLASLKPAFIKPHGTVTAGNASFLTDGASAGLVMDRDFALENGYKPKAILRSYSYVARRPGDELLIGPAFAVPKVLDDMKLKLDEIDVFEFHEAFAGQMLTVLKALASDDFAKERLGKSKAVGKVPYDLLNSRGGSLSIGHPFAATGVRMVTTAANRLIDNGGTYALIAACAAGGQGHAMLIERYEE
ncbi:acetyl-CoA C-acyltransferase [Rhodohalobacter sp. SW132]|uniref:acetyl-CoA C-acyltransferase n=1 Tax=Rhodohalobacter sp. SW132 TaxID=2293433 RepID=UPI000E26C580|nr:acetyl-CoA C-acyltransferase [Rhodohalobacter sp. SW132]REL38493.1 acetyl-CoA C-acyltransferase [Rhodohalobacter sp. SW132]